MLQGGLQQMLPSRPRWRLTHTIRLRNQRRLPRQRYPALIVHQQSERRQRQRQRQRQHQKQAQKQRVHQKQTRAWPGPS